MYLGVGLRTGEGLIHSRRSAGFAIIQGRGAEWKANTQLADNVKSQ